MKNIIRLLLLAVTLTTFSHTLFAQDNRQRLSREQLAEVQAKHIAGEIGMDNAASKRFINTYCRFQQEIWALGPRPKQVLHSMTEEETGEILKARFSRSQKILDIRQKYYAIYSEFLTQKQIQRVYELERQIMHRLAQHGKKPNR